MRPVDLPCNGCRTSLTLAAVGPLDQIRHEAATSFAELLDATGDPRATAWWELWTCPNPACRCGCRAWRERPLAATG